MCWGKRNCSKENDCWAFELRGGRDGQGSLATLFMAGETHSIEARVTKTAFSLSQTVTITQERTTLLWSTRVQNQPMVAASTVVVTNIQTTEALWHTQQQKTIERRKNERMRRRKINKKKCEQQCGEIPGVVKLRRQQEWREVREGGKKMFELKVKENIKVLSWRESKWRMMKNNIASPMVVGQEMQQFENI